jgi:hydroxyacylglutathione hydrolase
MTTTDLTIVPIETPTLGDRRYVVHDGEVAFVVDPQRDIDRVLAVLDEHALRLTDVFETHLHNDYLTGGLALAQRKPARATTSMPTTRSPSTGPRSAMATPSRWDPGCR